MADVRAVTLSVLTPYLGEVVADTCVRATAISLGKSSDDLDPGDLPALESNVRKLLSPIATTQKIEDLVHDIREGVLE